MIEKRYLKTRPVCKVTFTLPLEAAPHAREVQLLGDFNDWDPQRAPSLIKKSKGYQVTLELPPGKEFAFRYLIDGEHWENDWSADAYRPGAFGEENSLLVLEHLEPKPAPRKRSKKAKLQRIEGIGPKIEALLYKEGIFSYADLAEASADRLKGILATAGGRYKAHDPDSWPRQAALARDEKWDKLKTFQDTLDGGRAPKARKKKKKKK